jgi:hypothetical protein
MFLSCSASSAVTIVIGACMLWTGRCCSFSAILDCLFASVRKIKAVGEARRQEDCIMTLQDSVHAHDIGWQLLQRRLDISDRQEPRHDDWLHARLGCSTSTLVGEPHWVTLASQMQFASARTRLDLSIQLSLLSVSPHSSKFHQMQSPNYMTRTNLHDKNSAIPHGPVLQRLNGFFGSLLVEGKLLNDGRNAIFRSELQHLVHLSRRLRTFANEL